MCTPEPFTELGTEPKVGIEQFSGEDCSTIAPDDSEEFGALCFFSTALNRTVQLSFCFPICHPLGREIGGQVSRTKLLARIAELEEILKQLSEPDTRCCTDGFEDGGPKRHAAVHRKRLLSEVLLRLDGSHKMKIGSRTLNRLKKKAARREDSRSGKRKHTDDGTSVAISARNGLYVTGRSPARIVDGGLPSLGRKR